MIPRAIVKCHSKRKIWYSYIAIARAAERKVVEAVHDKLMEQMVAFDTHIKGNTLDLVFTNIPNRVT
jgi:hypothetical protein